MELASHVKCLLLTALPELTRSCCLGFFISERVQRQRNSDDEPCGDDDIITILVRLT